MNLLVVVLCFMIIQMIQSYRILKVKSVLSNIKRMMSNNSIETNKLIILCQDYVNNSNNHNVDLCLKDFNDNTEYISSAVGLYKGKTMIYNMMKGYFDKFPHVYWDVKSYTISEQYQNAIEFNFIRTGCQNNDGQDIVAEGKEWILFDDNIEISKVIVETTKTNVI